MPVISFCCWGEQAEAGGGERERNEVTAKERIGTEYFLYEKLFRWTGIYIDVWLETNGHLYFLFDLCVRFRNMALNKNANFLYIPLIWVFDVVWRSSESSNIVRGRKKKTNTNYQTQHFMVLR